MNTVNVFYTLKGNTEYAAKKIAEKTAETLADIDSFNEFKTLLKDILHGLFNFLIKAGIAVLIYIVILKLTKKFCRWLDNRMIKHDVDPAIRSFMVSITKYGILVFSLAMIVVQLNIVEGVSIAALLASAGVGISLALQGTLSNFAGGVLILLLKPFKAGDYIQVKAENVEGTVQRIEMYYTTICGIDLKTHRIPNSELTGHTITNFTEMENRKINQIVSISYSSDLKKAKSVIEEILKEDPRIEKDEETLVFVSNLGESSVDIGYRAWVKTENYWQTYWDLNEKIKLTLDEQGIEIPFNQLDVHIRNEFDLG